MTPQQIIFGLVLPALVFGASLALVHRIWKRTDRPETPRQRTAIGSALTGVFLCAAFIYATSVAFAKIVVPPSLSMSSEYWLAYIAAAGGLAGAIEALVLRMWARAVPLRAAVMLGAAWLLVSPLMRSGYFDAREGWIHIALAAAGGLSIWSALAQLENKCAGRLSSICIAAYAGLCAPTLVMWALEQDGRLAGLISICAGVAFALALWRKRVSLGSSGAAVSAVILSALLIHGFVYGDSPPVASAALLALAPWGGLAGTLPVVKKLPAWMRAAISVGAVVVIAGAALAIAAQSAPLDEYLKFAPN